MIPIQEEGGQETAAVVSTYHSSQNGLIKRTVTVGRMRDKI